MGRGCEVCSFDLCAVSSHTWLLHSWPAVTNVCVLIFVCIAGATKIETKNWTCVNDSFAPYGGAKVFSGAGTVFFSYLGFDMVSSMAEEVTKPQRDLPLGIIGSLVIAGACCECCADTGPRGSWLVSWGQLNRLLLCCVCVCLPCCAAGSIYMAVTLVVSGMVCFTAIDNLSGNQAPLTEAFSMVHMHWATYIINIVRGWRRGLCSPCP